MENIVIQSGGVLNDAAVLQVGRSQDVLPGANLGDPGEEVRLFQLPGKPTTDHSSQMVTVFFEARPIQQESGLFFGGGPVVGILEFSAGGGNLTRIEFDVPIAIPQPNSANPADFTGQGNQPNGVSISVPASGVIASARLDSKVELAVNTLDPLTDQSIINNVGQDLQAIVSARIGYNPKSGHPSSIRRTQWIAVIGSEALGVGANVVIGIPNHAIAVEFPRIGTGATPLPPIEVFARNFINVPYQRRTFAANDFGPMVLTPNTNSLQIINDSGNPITALQAVYTIGF